MTQLPNPTLEEARAWVAEHLGELTLEGTSGVRRSTRFTGGQAAADAALSTFSVGGYAARRNQVLPESARGASGLSPFIRHGLLTLPRVWDAVADGPSRDVRKFRDELLWQEYARHLYARVGRAIRRPLRRQPAVGEDWSGEPWPAEMACLAEIDRSLTEEGWLVNQSRMWAASHWTVRAGQRWQDGERGMFRQLLDGSTAANGLGWQWTIGAGTGKPYGFSRWQVEKRAPELCRQCPLRQRCPIQAWPEAQPGTGVEPVAELRHDPDPERTAGPAEPRLTGSPEAVWLTAESLGDDDPALAAHPELPVVFVFDAPLLARLRLAGHRLGVPGRGTGRPQRASCGGAAPGRPEAGAGRTPAGGDLRAGARLRGQVRPPRRRRPAPVALVATARRWLGGVVQRLGPPLTSRVRR